MSLNTLLADGQETKLLVHTKLHDVLISEISGLLEILTRAGANLPIAKKDVFSSAAAHGHVDLGDVVARRHADRLIRAGHERGL